MSFFTKYRPQKISELDLVSARETLLSFTKKDHLPQAILFSGPKGTGKTSAARIVAKGINCEKNDNSFDEPCNKCAMCLSITSGTCPDVIEMDAASNRGIDDIRNLKSDIMLSPLVARKKVYIIDEVHMLTTEASNALLKTLEEPPSHVVFLLATTDPQKLPQTVLSRLVRVDFKKASKKEIIGRLKDISEKEGIKAENEAFEVIYEASDGAFRDAVRILEEISYKMIEPGSVLTGGLASDLTSLDSSQTAQKLVKLLIDEEPAAFEVLYTIDEKGFDVKRINEQCIRILYEDLTKSFSQRTLFVLDAFLAGSQKNWYAPYPIATLASIVAHCLKALNDDSKMGGSGQLRSKDDNNRAVVVGGKIKAEQSAAKENMVDLAGTSYGVLPEVMEVEMHESQKVESDNSLGATERDGVHSDNVLENSSDKFVDQQLWSTMLGLLKGKNTTVEALIKASKPLRVTKEQVVLGVYYKFHKDKLESAQSREIIDGVASKVCGEKLRVEFVMEENDRPKLPDFTLTDVPSPAIIKAAKDIFS